MRRFGEYTIFLLMITILCSFRAANPSPEQKVSGYIQGRYEYDEAAQRGSKSTFFLRRARLMTSGKASDRTKYCAEIEVAGPQKVGERALVEVKNCYIEVSEFISGAILRLGEFKVPFGHEIPQSTQLLETPELALVLRRLFPNQSYDRGVELQGELTEALNFQIALINGVGESSTDNNTYKDLVLRVSGWSERLKYGLSWYLGENFDPGAKADVTKNRWGLDFQYYPTNQTTWKAEYIKGKDKDTEKAGWYIQLRQDWGDAYSLLLKHDRWDPDITRGGDTQITTALGAIWHLDKVTHLSSIYEFKAEERASRDNNILTIQLQVDY